MIDNCPGQREFISQPGDNYLGSLKTVPLRGVLKTGDVISGAGLIMSLAFSGRRNWVNLFENPENLGGSLGFGVLRIKCDSEYSSGVDGCMHCCGCC